MTESQWATCPGCKTRRALKVNGAFKPHAKGQRGQSGHASVCPGANRRPDGTIPPHGYGFMMPPEEPR